MNLPIKAWSSVYHKVSADLVRVVEAGAQHLFSCFTELHDQRDPEGTRLIRDWFFVMRFSVLV